MIRSMNEGTATAQGNSLSRSDYAYTSCYCEENVYHLLNSLLVAQPAQIHSHSHSLLALPQGRQFDLFAVFISNQHRQIPIWNHWDRTTNQSRVVCWDYHVIVVARPQSLNPSLQADVSASGEPVPGPEGVLRCNDSLVLDLDSALAFPASFSDYARHALRADLDLDPQFTRSYRVVPAAEYLDHFASDRRHMRRTPVVPAPSDLCANDVDHWIMPPPPHPPIRGSKALSDHNLEAFLSMPGDRDSVSNTQSWVPGRVVSQDEFFAMFLGPTGRVSGGLA